MKRKIFTGALTGLASFAFFVSSASAHVVVKPAQVGIGAFQTFTIGVPVEKELATVGLRLVVPEGLNYVTPNVKPGWKIDVKKEPVTKDGKQAMSEDGDEKVERVSEISWTGGNIPAGQRDEFLFSAQVPASSTIIPWKAYQTYADGSVVAWDASAKAVADQKKVMDEAMKKDPNMKMDASEDLHPYSETKVVDDLSATNGSASSGSVSVANIKSATQNSKIGLVVSVVALLLAVVAINRKS